MTFIPRHFGSILRSGREVKYQAEQKKKRKGKLRTGREGKYQAGQKKKRGNSEQDKIFERRIKKWRKIFA